MCRSRKRSICASTRAPDGSALRDIILKVGAAFALAPAPEAARDVELTTRRCCGILSSRVLTHPPPPFSRPPQPPVTRPSPAPTVGALRTCRCFSGLLPSNVTVYADIVETLVSAARRRGQRRAGWATRTGRLRGRDSEWRAGPLPSGPVGSGPASPSAMRTTAGGGDGKRAESAVPSRFRAGPSRAATRTDGSRGSRRRDRDHDGHGILESLSPGPGPPWPAPIKGSDPGRRRWPPRRRR